MGDTRSPRWIERFSLAGRRALVTGASRGIGEAICRVYADAGAHVLAAGRDEAALTALADELRDDGATIDVFSADLAKTADVDALAARALERVGTVDILVNNAGIAEVAPASELSLDDWDRTLAVNLRAPFQLARALAPRMIEQRWGKIVNISSQAAVVALEGHAAYSASKAGLNALTRGLMVEWARHNIQVNAICPTIVLTPMGHKVWGDEARAAPMLSRTPLGRFGEPIEVADLALYLASPAAELVNGECVMIEGGFSAI